LREPPPKSDATPNTPTRLPDAKHRAKYHGTVVLSVVISTEGIVEQTHVVRSANPDLDKKAAEQVSRWRFLPARKKGLPVPSVMPVEINFDLH
jgi:protein TonB